MAVVMRDVEAVFCAGHRVLGLHRCNSLHGHSYRVKVRWVSNNLSDQVDGNGEVPGAEFDHSLQRYCDQYLDRKLILSDQDGFQTDDLNTLRLPYNPTLENLARYFGTVICPGLPIIGALAQIVSVTVSDERASVVWIHEIDE